MKFPTLISVPSSSGKSLQPRGRCRLTRGRVDFSPLFIGEITSTTASCCVFSNSCVFQSPLHRGNHFNLFIVLKGHPPGLISVPSSSGKSLQPNAQCAENRTRAHFSPLFIGEITSTPLMDGSDKIWIKFQSPLHRGNHFNATLLNPILPTDKFQSPLHRGNHFNTSPDGNVFIAKAISVPSTSGKSLQL